MPASFSSAAGFTPTLVGSATGNSTRSAKSSARPTRTGKATRRTTNNRPRQYFTWIFPLHCWTAATGAAPASFDGHVLFDVHDRRLAKIVYHVGLMLVQTSRTGRPRRDSTTDKRGRWGARNRERVPPTRPQSIVGQPPSGADAA